MFLNHVRIIPVHKSGPRELCANYLPIVITSWASRLMERIISRHVLQLIRDRVSPSQHGFLSGCSIETAGVEYLNVVTASLDKGMCVDTIYLDFSKLFDTVPHSLLLKALFVWCRWTSSSLDI